MSKLVEDLRAGKIYGVAKMRQPKTYATIELRFKSKEEAKDFVAMWLDGGGEQSCGYDTIFEESDDWSKAKGLPRWLKLEKYEEDAAEEYVTVGSTSFPTSWVPFLKEPTQVEINKALTKMLHSYEALMQNPAKEIKKWYAWAGGEPDGCTLCHTFRDMDTDFCGVCPLSTNHTVGCVDETFTSLAAAIDNRKRGYFKSNDGHIKNLALERYMWLLRKLDEQGYEYK